jgi:CBS domain containing-hemolysin-like protein
VAGVAALVGSLAAGGDAAMNSLSAGKLAALHETTTGPLQARLGRYIENPSKVLGRWLVARVLMSTVTAVSICERVNETAAELRPIVAVAGSLLVLATLFEVTSAVARARAAELGPWLLWLLRPLEIAMVPLADPLSRLGRAIGHRLTVGISDDPKPRLAESEVEHLVDDAAKTGQIEAEPAEMIRNVLDFKDLTGLDVMVPRIKMTAIEVETPLTEILDLVTREGHSRYPVYAQRIDNVVGVLYAKDLFPLMRSDGLARTRLRDLMHAPVNFVPDGQRVSTILRDMRSRRQHLAILVDEFGGVSGLVTLEDLLERIVGDIRDEYDREEAPIQDIGQGRLLADASVSLADLSTYLGTEIEVDADVGSLGGLITHELGRVPSAGEQVSASGLEFIVRESDARRIIKVEIVLPPPSGLPAAPDAPPSGEAR